MKHNPHFFKETMPEWKRKKDPIIARYIHRPISFLFSSLFVEMGMTPNQVSFISLIISVLTCFLFAVPNAFVILVGYFLLNLWSITDSADGNMARSLGGKPYGDFIDATSSYFMYGMMFLPLAYSASKMGNTLLQMDALLLIAVGALAGSFDTMTRLFFQKMKNNAYEIRMAEQKAGIYNDEDITDRTNSIIGRIQGRLDSEFTCGGTIHLVLFPICFFTHSMDLYILLYFFYNSLTFFASVIYLKKKTRCLEK